MWSPANPLEGREESLDKKCSKEEGGGELEKEMRRIRSSKKSGLTSHLCIDATTGEPVRWGEESIDKDYSGEETTSLGVDFAHERQEGDEQGHDGHLHSVANEAGEIETASRRPEHVAMHLFPAVLVPKLSLLHETKKHDCNLD